MTEFFSEYGYVIVLSILFLCLLFICTRQKKIRYTAKEFMEQWIIDRNSEDGLKYKDRPGCYVITSYGRFKPLSYKRFKNVYVGQSELVYNRVHNHLIGHGNGDVYSDMRDERFIYIVIYPCREKKLNRLEIELIERFDARKSYNKTAGGAGKR